MSAYNRLRAAEYAKFNSNSKGNGDGINHDTSSSPNGRDDDDKRMIAATPPQTFRGHVSRHNNDDSAMELSSLSSATLSSPSSTSSSRSSFSPAADDSTHDISDSEHAMVARASSTKSGHRRLLTNNDNNDNGDSDDHHDISGNSDTITMIDDDMGLSAISLDGSVSHSPVSYVDATIYQLRDTSSQYSLSSLYLNQLLNLPLEGLTCDCAASIRVPSSKGKRVTAFPRPLCDIMFDYIGDDTLGWKQRDMVQYLHINSKWITGEIMYIDSDKIVIGCKLGANLRHRLLSRDEWIDASHEEVLPRGSLRVWPICVAVPHDRDREARHEIAPARIIRREYDRINPRKGPVTLPVNDTKYLVSRILLWCHLLVHTSLIIAFATNAANIYLSAVFHCDGLAMSACVIKPECRWEMVDKEGDRINMQCHPLNFSMFVAIACFTPAWFGIQVFKAVTLARLMHARYHSPSWRNIWRRGLICIDFTFGTIVFALLAVISPFTPAGEKWALSSVLLISCMINTPLLLATPSIVAGDDMVYANKQQRIESPGAATRVDLYFPAHVADEV